MREATQQKISIIGAGAWGTALAQSLAAKGMPVTLWAREDALAQTINSTQENAVYLSGIPLSTQITATGDLMQAAKSEILLIACPAQYMRTLLGRLKTAITNSHALILCSKGIELDSGKMMSDIVQEILPGITFAVLTGPNFAHEIARGQPAATTLACTDPVSAQHLQEAVASRVFRPYVTDDITGAQIAGAMKNVIAIACGMAHGLNFGESTRASLVTRGMSEIARLGHAMGARYETFLGLCGIGDLMLTCSSESSRNFSLGSALGRGESLEDVLAARRSVTEGVHTARAAIALAQKHNIEMPISLAVHKCLNEGLALDAAMQEMLNRPLGNEL